MKFSMAWLREHVAIEEAAAALGARLTAAGHALDGMEVAGDDTLLDLDITTNRPDCLSVRGLAREIAALTQRQLADLPPLLAVAETGRPAAESMSLAIESPDLCRRFVARVVRGVRVGPSPGWMAQRLRDAGVRPVNNVVDATQYVMLELGHPLHAFDLGALKGGALHIRRARAGEALRTLDGVERRLADWMLVVADAERAVSLAGVMGGQETEIRESTLDVLLEGAWWDPVTIYRTARALGLQSDASYRFERRADPEACAAAVNRCARLLADVAGGSVAPGALDEYPGRQVAATALFRPARAAALLGFELSRDEALAALASLGFKVQAGAASWQVEIPSHRGDVATEVDLIEEAGRVAGFDRIPEILPLVAAEERGLARAQERVREARQVLEGAGYFEAINMALVSRAEEGVFARDAVTAPALANPMSEKGEVLRTSLLPALVRNAALNARHGAERIRLFEVARVFQSRGDAVLPDERLHLALVASGPVSALDWQAGPTREADLFEVKGALEAVLAALGAALPEMREDGPPHLRPGAAVTWSLAGEEVAWFGLLAPAAAAPFELERDAAVAEIDLTPFLALPPAPVQYRPLPRHPGIVRDLSLTVPDGQRYRDIEAAIRAAGGSLVEDVVPFDRFRGKGLRPGISALGVRIRFQHAERTLVSEEIDALQQRIVAALAPMGIALRES
jgi:phenylalanyl-tRNA synthetase beta chain